MQNLGVAARIWAMLVIGYSGVALAQESAKVELLREPSSSLIRAIDSVSFSPDGKSLVAAGFTRVVVWDVASGRPLRRLDGRFPVAWSLDGKKIAVAGRDNTTNIFEAANGQQLLTLKGHSLGIKSVAWSPDGKSLATGGGDNQVIVWDVASGQAQQKFKDNASVRCLAWSPDGKWIALGSSYEGIKVWYLAGKKITFARLVGNDKGVSSLAWSADGKLIVSGGGRASWFTKPTGERYASSLDETIRVWGVNQSHFERKLEISAKSLGLIALSPNAGSIVSLSTDLKYRVWDAATGQLLRTLEGSQPSIISSLTTLTLSPDGKIIASSSAGTVQLLNEQTGNLLLSLVEFTDDNWLAYTPDGYYNCSQGASKYAVWRIGDKVYEESQVKDKLFKPEIIAARLGFDRATLGANQPASVVSATDNSTPATKDTKPPVIRITSPEIARGVGTKKSDSKLSVAGQATDESGVSEVMVQGIAARPDTQGNFSTEILLKLGDNPVKVTATDIYGNKAEENFTIRREEPPVAEAKPPTPRPKLDPVPAWAVRKAYALVIGNNKYQHLAALKTAIADAEQVERMLHESFGFETKLLKDAKREEIVLALSEYRRKLDVNTDLLIYYAGHGFYDTDVNKAYWLPVDARDSDVANWISADDVTTSIKGMRAKHVLVVSDSCFSGTLARNTVSKLTTPLEHDKYLRKMVEGISRTLMASGGNEPVADGGGKGHSIFASALLRGLELIEEPIFTADELFFQFVREPVAGKSEQTPEYNPLRNSGHESGDFVFVRRKP